MNELYIKNTTIFVFKYKSLFKKIVDLVCEFEKIEGDSEVNLIIVSNKKMQLLSQKFRHINKPTDVLSFPNDYQELKQKVGYNMLGDIYISYEKIELQAREYNHSLKREGTYIFTHGVYHLLGFDHQNKQDEMIMNEKVEAIMKQIKVARND